MKRYSSLFFRQLGREFLLQVRQIRSIVNTCLFFIVVLVFFPLTMPADSPFLQAIAPGLAWIAMLLAMLLSAERMFQQDFQEGIIEQWLVSGLPLVTYVYAKVLIHWLLNITAILLFCPFLALLFNLSTDAMLMLMLSLLMGTPAILFLCALASAFSAGIQQKGVLMALILLPLTIPVMVFGSALLTAAMAGLPIAAYIALLSAFSLLAIACLPFATAGVIRVGLA